MRSQVEVPVEICLKSKFCFHAHPEFDWKTQFHAVVVYRILAIRVNL